MTRTPKAGVAAASLLAAAVLARNEPTECPYFTAMPNCGFESSDDEDFDAHAFFAGHAVVTVEGKLQIIRNYANAMRAYVQALKAAAADGVDVRLLVPGATDLSLLRPVSRAGYRPLLQAGVRIFEWNGTMLHAKTAVADGNWARVGSTNLNVSIWFGNCELDAVVEDESFAAEMEVMYLQDLENATEIVLDTKRKVRPAGEPGRAAPAAPQGGDSVGRAAAGVLRIGHAVGAAFTHRRVLEPVEARLMATAGTSFLSLATLIVLFPIVLVAPLVGAFVWLGAALLVRSYRLRRAGRLARRATREDTPPDR